ncbi:MAG: hypothetical protein EON91_02600 [Brevundimonas sp.]|uniref:hypothetical protein n=1 Tax=Brevundimonas sp. TaxID=1871086 RepID=UPI0011FC1122|nr:hypothetical protein [Brevundimonas sp.]RZJ19103.1 MAG: hypothetical protein EON91_02600 [Brevundimonas sp.]
MTRAVDVPVGFVIEKRALRCSWSAIARMAGVTEHDLRRHHDAAWTGGVVPVRAESPREMVRRALRRAGLDEESALIVARLWHANAGRVATESLTRGIIGGGGAYVAVVEARRRAATLGITFAPASGRGFALTPEGVVRVAHIADLRPEREAA